MNLSEDFDWEADDEWKFKHHSWPSQ
jgi:hypothetical protein